MDYPEVVLEIDIPAHRHPGVKIPGGLADALYLGPGERPNKGEGFIFTLPPVRKLRLTEACEIALFGSLTDNRNYCMPPLFDKVPLREAVGFLTEEQAAIYNERQDRLHDSQEEAARHHVKAGVVKVKESDWDIKMENV